MQDEKNQGQDQTPEERFYRVALRSYLEMRVRSPYVRLMAKLEPSCTVFYDGSCPMCRAEIALYQKADGAEAVRFADVSIDTFTSPDLTRDAAMARFHMRDANGVLQSGARAFIALWLLLPRWRWLGTIASVPPLPMILEGAYRLFLPMRPAIQKWMRRRSQSS